MLVVCSGIIVFVSPFVATYVTVTPTNFARSLCPVTVTETFVPSMVCVSVTSPVILFLMFVPVLTVSPVNVRLVSYRLFVFERSLTVNFVSSSLHVCLGGGVPLI